MKLCKCGCEGEVTIYKYMRGHSSRVKKYRLKQTPCFCGCGQLAKKGNKFLHGHNRSGIAHTRDEIDRIRESNLITYSDPKLLEKLTGKNGSFYGRTHSKAACVVMSRKARKRCSNPDFIRKIAIATKKALDDPEVRKKISKNSKAMWKNKESQERIRISRGIKPNRAEVSLRDLLEGLYPGEWKYTGDFSLIIDGKCPDFVNCNGQKKIIELFGDYWHKGDDPQDRIDIFKPFGYDTLVVWEHELRDVEELTDRIGRFVNADK